MVTKEGWERGADRGRRERATATAVPTRRKPGRDVRSQWLPERMPPRSHWLLMLDHAPAGGVSRPACGRGPEEFFWPASCHQSIDWTLSRRLPTALYPLEASERVPLDVVHLFSQIRAGISGVQEQGVPRDTLYVVHIFAQVSEVLHTPRTTCTRKKSLDTRAGG